MALLDWISAGVVVGSMLYLTFALTIPQWIRLLRRGEGVALWPQRGDREVAWWKQLFMILFGIGLGIVLFKYLWIPFARIPEPALTGLRAAGLLLYIGGFAFMMWARKTLGRNWGISTSLRAKLQADHALVTHGPYALARHPMYFGALVLSVGSVLIYPMWVILLLAVSMMFSLTMRARREEALLAERYGDAWMQYKQRTRFLIPHLL